MRPLPIKENNYGGRMRLCILLSAIAHIPLLLHLTPITFSSNFASPLQISFIDLPRPIPDEAPLTQEQSEIQASSATENNVAQNEISEIEEGAESPVIETIPPAQINDLIESFVKNSQQGSTPSLASERPAPTVEPRKTTAMIVEEKLFRILNDYFKYPAIARRRGWEGEVLLSLSIEYDGRLDNIHLVKSSGYTLLDNSAIEAVNKIKSIPGEYETVVNIQIPVIYRLREG
jgi:protein TonB